jgi:hypothetical protein
MIFFQIKNRSSFLFIPSQAKKFKYFLLEMIFKERLLLLNSKALNFKCLKT